MSVKLSEIQQQRMEIAAEMSSRQPGRVQFNALDNWPSPLDAVKPEYPSTRPQLGKFRDQYANCVNPAVDIGVYDADNMPKGSIADYSLMATTPTFCCMPWLLPSGPALSRSNLNAQPKRPGKQRPMPKITKCRGENRKDFYWDISPWHVGAHVSVAGGVENAVLNAASIGANAFAPFLKFPRQWASGGLNPSNIEKFKARIKEYYYEPRDILPHGSNLGNPDAWPKSYECFVDDLNPCEQLRLEVNNFQIIRGCNIDKGINRTHCGVPRLSHVATTSVATVLENIAGNGHIIGSDFSHLADIIAAVEDKTRVGICLDMCLQSATISELRKDGKKHVLCRSLCYLIAGIGKLVTKFDQRVYLSYLRGMHLKDLKTDFASKRDCHENIGMGYIGLAPFHHILTDRRVQGIPLILEPPEPETWATEIEVLNELSTCAKLDERKKALLCRIRKSLKELHLRTGPVQNRTGGPSRQQRTKPADEGILSYN
ncbi:xylose isomerase-like protein [Armillaria borealis]|uniref:Xylose isomerase-like protein n=1 Tax=Armillaria borealis TaxID=47425 RepID=A0AA39MJ61_9AGAR|nr:xylose isomerase-like protein [Armillaria borealis]